MNFSIALGWQYRWFSVDPQTGTLSYYICENNPEGASPPNFSGSTPRWQEHLAGAVVCPSDEDSRTFTIGTANGDTLKLRANDARARQEWVDVLRNIAECHTQVRIPTIYLSCWISSDTPQRCGVLWLDWKPHVITFICYVFRTLLSSVDWIPIWITSTTWNSCRIWRFWWSTSTTSEYRTMVSFCCMQKEN